MSIEIKFKLDNNDDAITLLNAGNYRRIIVEIKEVLRDFRKYRASNYKCAQEIAEDIEQHILDIINEVDL